MNAILFGMSDLSYLHALYGVIATPVVAEAIYRSKVVSNYARSIAYSAATMVSVGFLKEANDMYHVIESVAGMPQWNDVLLDVAGVAIGASVAFVGNGLRNRRG